MDNDFKLVGLETLVCLSSSFMGQCNWDHGKSRGKCSNFISCAFTVCFIINVSDMGFHSLEHLVYRLCCSFGLHDVFSALTWSSSHFICSFKLIRY